MRKSWNQAGYRSTSNLALIVALFVALSGASAIAAQGGYEPPTTLNASQILPPDLLSGPNHRVEEKVTNDGLLNTYRVGSKFGTLTAVSTPVLKKRILEINALVTMEKISKTSVYTAALKEAGANTLSGVKNLVLNPVQTLSGAASGIGAAFSRVTNSLSGPKRSQSEDAQVKDLIGYSKAKREIAFQLGVDVYSDNEKLQSRLNEISWASFAGGLTWNAAMMAVPGGAGVAFSVTGNLQRLNEIFRDNPPVELRRMNGEKLAAMDVNREIADAFLNNAVYSPRGQTILVNALEGMKGVANRAAFIRLATSLSDANLALFRQRQAEMYAGYNRVMSPIETFLFLGEFAVARTVKSDIVFNVPLDHLVWTEPVAGLIAAANQRVSDLTGVQEKQLWVTGTVSARAKKEIESRGWKVQENSEPRLLE
jgi:hypothetical protein